MKIFLILLSSSNIDEKRAKFFTIIFQLFDHLIIQHVRQVAAFRFRVDFKGDGAPLRFLISHFSPPDFHSPSLPKIFCFILASGSSIGWFWWIDWNFRYKLLSTDVAVVSLLTAARIIFEAWFLRTSMDGNASKLLMRDAHAYPAQCTYAGHDFRPTISTSCACLFEGGVSGFITLFDMDSFKLSNALRFFSLLFFPSLVVLLLHSRRGKLWIEFVSSF